MPQALDVLTGRARRTSQKFWLDLRTQQDEEAEQGGSQQPALLLGVDITSHVTLRLRVVQRPADCTADSVDIRLDELPAHRIVGGRPSVRRQFQVGYGPTGDRF